MPIYGRSITPIHSVPSTHHVVHHLWVSCDCHLDVTIRRLLYAKEMTCKGKDGSTSVLYNLTNGSAWADSEYDVSRTRTSGSKGESMTAAAEAGVEDTSSDGYR